MCFPRGKTKFIRPDGSIGRAPGHGVVLLGMGAVANKALAQCGLGFFVPIDTSDAKRAQQNLAFFPHPKRTGFVRRAESSFHYLNI